VLTAHIGEEAMLTLNARDKNDYNHLCRDFASNKIKQF